MVRFLKNQPTIQNKTAEATSTDISILLIPPIGSGEIVALHPNTKKNSGIAVGNVIGSNLFNIFFVLGCSATISPLPMGGINNIDMAVLVASAVLFWIVGWFFKKRTITRVEGGLLVACYVAYTAYLIAMQ